MSDEKTDSGLGRRKLKNLFVDKSMQNRLGLNILAINFIVAGTGFFIIVDFVTDLQNALTEIPTIDNQSFEMIAVALTGIVTTALVTVILNTAVNYLAGVYFAHRFAGPSKIIISTLDEMIRGEAPSRKDLRPTDEMQEIMMKLQELHNKYQKS